MERFLDHYAGAKPPTVQFAKRAWEPAVDVYETGDKLVIAVDLAGIDCEHLEISADRRTIVIRGQRFNPGCGTQKLYYQMEIDSGPFERIIPLPVAIDSDSATACYNEGMVEITVPKSKAQPARTAFIRIFPRGNER
ncbi:MAG: Hsp20/alpha crystallin family protein [Chloroflexi bacterium]|nr:Hsp20/alpha crystallin family protein [Chloroflexota bacterium]